MPESESAAALRNSTTRPLYSAWSFFLDHGIVGGKLVSGTDQGMAVAALVLDLRQKGIFRPASPDGQPKPLYVRLRGTRIALA